jgi:hypothetical protein
MAEKKKDKPSWRDILKPLFLNARHVLTPLPQTINESVRAIAFQRSLPNKTQLKVGRSGNVIGVGSFSRANNRSVGASITPPTAGRKLPTSGIAFTGPQGFSDQPFPGGAKNAKHQALLWQLGDIIENLPAGGVEGTGSDARRRNAYQRYGIGPEGLAYKRPDNGKLQPRSATGQLGKATDAAGRLKGGLGRLAAGNVVRQLAPLMVQRLQHPYVQAYQNVDNIVRQITGEGITERTVGGTRDQLQQTLEKNQTINFGPLLPF